MMNYKMVQKMKNLNKVNPIFYKEKSKLIIKSKLIKYNQLKY